ncbi:unnamed protein product [Paramecium pentaurelia]|uniref:Uncharacterized protein n=1 Tax=Paramecium pentaurelia TaxID=43138 RepID=A0A8S1WGU3_9CILI|nr:unnamed protein product [Paramecium pentaurelia]
MFPRILKTQNSFSPYTLFMNKNCYNLALELKQYLMSDYLLTQFPILQLPDYMENTFALHVNLLQQRLLNEKNTQSEKDIDHLRFFLKTYVYSELANKYNEKYPADAFSEYFIENYQNRVEIMAPEFKILDNDMQTLQRDEIDENTRKFIRKFIFLNKIGITNNIIQKYSNYVMAHMNYLHSLQYIDIMQYKIYWGMQEELKQLNN